MDQIGNSFCEQFNLSIYLIFEPGKNWIRSHDDGENSKHSLF